MTKGAICLIDDYCDPGIHPDGWNPFPGVKKAYDEFLADKSEKIYSIYSGAYNHGYFRKA
jgi:O-methyltransferase